MQQLIPLQLVTIGVGLAVILRRDKPAKPAAKGLGAAGEGSKAQHDGSDEADLERSATQWLARNRRSGAHSSLNSEPTAGHSSSYADVELLSDEELVYLRSDGNVLTALVPAGRRLTLQPLQLAKGQPDAVPTAPLEPTSVWLVRRWGQQVVFELQGPHNRRHVLEADPSSPLGAALGGGSPGRRGRWLISPQGLVSAAWPDHVLPFQVVPVQLVDARAAASVKTALGRKLAEVTAKLEEEVRKWSRSEAQREALEGELRAAREESAAQVAELRSQLDAAVRARHVAERETVALQAQRAEEVARTKVAQARAAQAEAEVAAAEAIVRRQQQQIQGTLAGHAEELRTLQHELQIAREANEALKRAMGEQVLSLQGALELRDARLLELEEENDRLDTVLQVIQAQLGSASSSSAAALVDRGCGGTARPTQESEAGAGPGGIPFATSATLGTGDVAASDGLDPFQSIGAGGDEEAPLWRSLLDATGDLSLTALKESLAISRRSTAEAAPPQAGLPAAVPIPTSSVAAPAEPPAAPALHPLPQHQGYQEQREEQIIGTTLDPALPSSSTTATLLACAASPAVSTCPGPEGPQAFALTCSTSSRSHSPEDRRRRRTSSGSNCSVGSSSTPAEMVVAAAAGGARNGAAVREWGSSGESGAGSVTVGGGGEEAEGGEEEEEGEFVSAAVRLSGGGRVLRTVARRPMEGEGALAAGMRASPLESWDQQQQQQRRRLREEEQVQMQGAGGGAASRPGVPSDILSAATTGPTATLLNPTATLEYGLEATLTLDSLRRRMRQLDAEKQRLELLSASLEGTLPWRAASSAGGAKGNRGAAQRLFGGASEGGGCSAALLVVADTATAAAPPLQAAASVQAAAAPPSSRPCLAVGSAGNNSAPGGALRVPRLLIDHGARALTPRGGPEECGQELTGGYGGGDVYDSIDGMCNLGSTRALPTARGGGFGFGAGAGGPPPLTARHVAGHHHHRQVSSGAVDLPAPTAAAFYCSPARQTGAQATQTMTAVGQTPQTPKPLPAAATSTATTTTTPPAAADATAAAARTGGGGNGGGTPGGVATPKSAISTPGGGTDVAGEDDAATYCDDQELSPPPPGGVMLLGPLEQLRRAGAGLGSAAKTTAAGPGSVVAGTPLGGARLGGRVLAALDEEEDE